MKLLLTSGGVTNLAIRSALVELLGKPIEESTALAIPTAQYGHPSCTPESAWRSVSGTGPTAMTNLGWASVGLLELTALATMPRKRWMPWVEAADALLVDGGDAMYLAHWLRASGLLDVMPRLRETVWVGVSAGSMVMTPRVGEEFVNWRDPSQDAKAADADRGLGWVDFSLFPHLDHPDMPGNTLDAARRWAAAIPTKGYALDDAMALVVTSDAAGDDPPAAGANELAASVPDAAAPRFVGEGVWHAV